MHRLNRVIAFLVVLAMALGARGALRAQQPPSPS
jgi:hypothetical protein